LGIDDPHSTPLQCHRFGDIELQSSCQLSISAWHVKNYSILYLFSLISDIFCDFAHLKRQKNAEIKTQKSVNSMTILATGGLRRIFDDSESAITPYVKILPVSCIYLTVLW
jgi:hypothetical protein